MYDPSLELAKKRIASIRKHLGDAKVEGLLFRRFPISQFTREEVEILLAYMADKQKNILGAELKCGTSSPGSMTQSSA